MIELRETNVFSDWLAGLRDRQARVRIQTRLTRLGQGNPGDAKAVSNGVCEMRINYGPGYRVYYVQRGNALVLLLCGGDKSTQDNDIKRALKIAGEV